MKTCIEKYEKELVSLTAKNKALESENDILKNKTQKN